MELSLYNLTSVAGLHMLYRDPKKSPLSAISLI